MSQASEGLRNRASSTGRSDLTDAAFFQLFFAFGVVDNRRARSPIASIQSYDYIESRLCVSPIPEFNCQLSEQCSNGTTNC